MLYIGIDLGTSSVKLVCMDEMGTIQASTTQEYPIYFPQPGWAEQDPLDWWNAVMDGCNALLQQVDRSDVKGISFSGQMHGLVTLDEYDHILRPAILWNDGRSIKECTYLNDIIGKEKVSKYCANIAFPGFTAPKLLWMKEHEIDNFNKIKKIMLPKDYLAYRFSGVFSSDVSDASGTLFFDVEHRCWSKEMMDICGINETQLPNIHESYEVIGTILPALANQLELSKDVKIIAGAGDNAAAAIGTGTIKEGACNISLGTSGTIFISSSSFMLDEHNALHSFAHANGHYHLMGCMLSAASCNKWWMDDILKTQEYEKEQEHLSETGENQVYFLPYLMGERSPHNDIFARGAFINLSMDTTREDMTQAVLEGVAFAIRDSFEIAKKLGIEITSSKICGGGAKSTYWKRMLANVLNITIEEVTIDEGPSFGAAMLAAIGCGQFKDVEDASSKLIHITNIIKPDARAIKYEARYQKFKQLYPALKDIFHTFNT